MKKAELLHIGHAKTKPDKDLGQPLGAQMMGFRCVYGVALGLSLVCRVCGEAVGGAVGVPWDEPMGAPKESLRGSHRQMTIQTLICKECIRLKKKPHSTPEGTP